MRKFYSRLRSSLSRKRQRNGRFKAACLSLGLATAWGGEAAADATLKVEITPQQTLTNALVYYGNNVSTGVLASLGTAPAGQTTTFFHTLRDDVFTPCQWVCSPESYGPGGNQRAYFVVIGLHQSATVDGVTVSFPNDAPIDAMATWESVFHFDPAPSLSVVEEDIIAALQSAEPIPARPPSVRSDAVDRMVTFYGGSSLSGILATDYGETATLVSFSQATFGGTAVVTVIPEPASWCLVVGAGGVAACSRRRLLAC